MPLLDLECCGFSFLRENLGICKVYDKNKNHTQELDKFHSIYYIHCNWIVQGISQHYNYDLLFWGFSHGYPYTGNTDHMGTIHNSTVCPPDT